MTIFLTMTICINAASETLTAAQTVEIGLANNYNIRIARNNIVKADNMGKMKVGSLLPTARADGSATYTNTEYYSPGSGSSGLGSISDGTSYSAGAGLNWTLFDGFKMFYALKQLDQQMELTRETSRFDIESSVVKILTAFYNLGSTRSILAASQQQLALSRKQLERIKAKWEFGGANNTDLLRQQVLVNADSSMVTARELDVVRALHDLNLALGRVPDMPLEVVIDTLVEPPENDAAFWYESAQKHNASLSMSQIQKNIAYSDLGIARAAFWPVLAANGSRSKTWGDNDYTRTSAGLTLSWPLFSGFRTLTTAQNAKIDTKNAELSHDQKQKELQAYIYQQWELLSNAYRQVSFEREAVILAEKSLTVSEEQFKVGRISDVQFRESQLALINAMVRHETALFQYKVATAQLQQLAGKLAIK
jgi:outer membrane protein TolC